MITVSPRRARSFDGYLQLFHWTELIQSIAAGGRACGLRGRRRRLPQEQRHHDRAALQPDEAQPRRRAGPRPHHRRRAPRHGQGDPRVPGQARSDLLPRPRVPVRAQRDHRGEGDRLARPRASSGSTSPGPSRPRFRVADYRRLFRRARQFGLGLTVHTGESGPVEEVARVIELLEPDRIGHGVKAAYDPRAMAMLADRGIVLEICPTSNLNTRVVSGWDEFRWIFDTFRRNEVRFTINTDGPEMLKTYIRDELTTLGRLGILSVEDQQQVAETSLAASFVPNVSDVPRSTGAGVAGGRRARGGLTRRQVAPGRTRWTPASWRIRRVDRRRLEPRARAIWPAPSCSNTRSVRCGVWSVSPGGATRNVASPPQVRSRSAALARPIRNRSSVPGGGSAPRNRCGQVDRTTQVAVRAPTRSVRAGDHGVPVELRAVAPDELGDVAHPAQPQGRPAPVDREVDRACRLEDSSDVGRPSSVPSTERAHSAVGIGPEEAVGPRSPVELEDRPARTRRRAYPRRVVELVDEGGERRLGAGWRKPRSSAGPPAAGSRSLGRTRTSRSAAPRAPGRRTAARAVTRPLTGIAGTCAAREAIEEHARAPRPSGRSGEQRDVRRRVAGSSQSAGMMDARRPWPRPAGVSASSGRTSWRWPRSHIRSQSRSSPQDRREGRRASPGRATVRAPRQTIRVSGSRSGEVGASAGSVLGQAAVGPGVPDHGRAGEQAGGRRSRTLRIAQGHERRGQLGQVPSPPRIEPRRTASAWVIGRSWPSAWRTAGRTVGRVEHAAEDDRRRRGSPAQRVAALDHDDRLPPASSPSPVSAIIVTQAPTARTTAARNRCRPAVQPATRYAERDERGGCPPAPTRAPARSMQDDGDSRVGLSSISSSVPVVWLSRRLPPIRPTTEPRNSDQGDADDHEREVAGPILDPGPVPRPRRRG